MKRRAAWFVAGAAAGLYASVRARRVAYRLTPPGLLDQAGALGVGIRAFGEEMRSGMSARESEILHQFGPQAAPPRLSHDQPSLSLDEGNDL
ncbi:MAG: hypothetical protein JWP10_484 [Nocardioidaceae bacterium]|nr:hypothetical protein [Nocardioidaceae bacterium]